MGKGTRVNVICARDGRLPGTVGRAVVDSERCFLGVKFAYAGCDARDSFIVVVGHECFC